MPGSTSVPQTQYALLQPDAADPFITSINDHPVPRLRPNSSDHLVRVHAAAITNGELLWQHDYPPPAIPDSPKVLVPCYDVAGTVVLAPDGSRFPAGTKVYARSDFRRTGAARQYTILTAEEMAVMPNGKLSWAEASCVPMSAETAWQALFVQAGLEALEGQGAKGLRILITAASGGVGVWMVQLAKWAGAYVVATCGQHSVEMVRKLGADEIVDRFSSIKAWASSNSSNQVDIAFDCIGGSALADAWWGVKDEGKLISVAGSPEQAKPEELENQKKGVKSWFFIMKSSGEQLQKITDELIMKRGARPSFDSVWRFHEYREAFEMVASGKARGKVVLDLDE